MCPPSCLFLAALFRFFFQLGAVLDTLDYHLEKLAIYGRYIAVYLLNVYMADLCHFICRMASVCLPGLVADLML